jgi:hypothetical protein
MERRLGRTGKERFIYHFCDLDVTIDHYIGGKSGGSCWVWVVRFFSLKVSPVWEAAGYF